jgi:hypothetical protein
MPAPPQRNPAFEKVEAEGPDDKHTGPAEKPTFIQVNVDDGVPRWLKLSAAVAAMVGAVIAALAFFFSKTNIGGMVVCGDYRDERIQRGN